MPRILCVDKHGYAAKLDVHTMLIQSMLRSVHNGTADAHHYLSCLELCFDLDKLAVVHTHLPTMTDSAVAVLVNGYENDAPLGHQYRHWMRVQRTPRTGKKIIQLISAEEAQGLGGPLHAEISLSPIGYYAANGFWMGGREALQKFSKTKEYNDILKELKS